MKIVGNVALQIGKRNVMNVWLDLHYQEVSVIYPIKFQKHHVKMEHTKIGKIVVNHVPRLTVKNVLNLRVKNVFPWMQMVILLLLINVMDYNVNNVTMYTVLSVNMWVHILQKNVKSVMIKLLNLAKIVTLIVWLIVFVTKQQMIVLNV